MSNRDLNPDWQNYPHQPKLSWRETPAGIEIRHRLRGGEASKAENLQAVADGRILWRTLRAALRRKDKA